MRSDGRRSAIAVAGFAIALVVIALLLRSAPSPNEEAPVSGAPPAAHAPAPIAPTVVAPAAPANVVAAAPAASSSGALGPTEAEVKAFRKWRIDALKEGGKYPGYSRPLTKRHYDALTVVEPEVARGNKKESETQREDALIVHALKPFYQANEVPVIRAEVINGKTGARSPVTISAIMLRIPLNEGEVQSVLGDLPFRDDGANGDEKAADLVYAATPQKELVEKLRGQIYVDVRAMLPDGRERRTLTSFRIGSPTAKLTGVFSDRIEDGHLILDAKVEIEKPGRYHLQGGLVGPGGEEIVWAQSAVAFDAPGPHVMSLKFFGLAFLSADVPGPYTLKFVSLAETGIRPVVQGPVLENAHVTKAYPLSVFSATPHQDPALAEVIQQAEGLVDEPVSGSGPPASK